MEVTSIRYISTILSSKAPCRIQAKAYSPRYWELDNNMTRWLLFQFLVSCQPLLWATFGYCNQKSKTKTKLKLSNNVLLFNHVNSHVCIHIIHYSYSKLAHLSFFFNLFTTYMQYVIIRRKNNQFESKKGEILKKKENFRLNL